MGHKTRTNKKISNKANGMETKSVQYQVYNKQEGEKTKMFHRRNRRCYKENNPKRFDIRVLTRSSGVFK